MARGTPVAQDGCARDPTPSRNLLKTLLSFITKFYYFDMYIFYSRNYKRDLLNDFKRLSKGPLHN